MIAGVYNFTIEQGTTIRRTFTFKDSTGTPINLSGNTAVMQIRPEVDSATAMVTLTTSNNGITLGGATGEIEIYITNVQTSAMTSDGVYDLELTNIASGDVTRVLKGKIRLDPEVTRA